MAVAVEMDEASNPVHVRLLGAQAVVPEADAGADEVEEAWRRVASRYRRIGHAIRYHAVDYRTVLATAASAIRGIDGVVRVISDGIYCGIWEGK